MEKFSDNSVIIITHYNLFADNNKRTHLLMIYLLIRVDPSDVYIELQQLTTQDVPHSWTDDRGRVKNSCKQNETLHLEVLDSESQKNLKAPLFTQWPKKPTFMTSKVVLVMHICYAWNKAFESSSHKFYYTVCITSLQIHSCWTSSNLSVNYAPRAKISQTAWNWTLHKIMGGW